MSLHDRRDHRARPGTVRIPSRVTYSEKAEADLREIWNHTAQIWGIEQADNYLRSIDPAAEDLVAGRLRSRAMDFVSPGLRKARRARHFIYFRIRNGGIRIERVLHERMDETLHLI